MQYDLYKFDVVDWLESTPHLRLWRSNVGLSELFREFGFPQVKARLRDLRHLEGVFLTPEFFLIPTGKLPHRNAAKATVDSFPTGHPELLRQHTLGEEFAQSNGENQIAVERMFETNQSQRTRAQIGVGEK